MQYRDDPNAAGYYDYPAPGVNQYDPPASPGFRGGGDAYAMQQIPPPGGRSRSPGPQQGFQGHGGRSSPAPSMGRQSPGPYAAMRGSPAPGYGGPPATGRQSPGPQDAYGYGR